MNYQKLNDNYQKLSDNYQELGTKTCDKCGVVTPEPWNNCFKCDLEECFIMQISDNALDAKLLAERLDLL